MKRQMWLAAAATCLAALSVVLGLAGNNLGELGVDDLARPIAVVIGGGLLCIGAISLWSRSLAYAFPVILVIFFYDYSLGVAADRLGLHISVFYLLGGLVVFLVYSYAKKKSPAKLNLLFIFVFGVQVAFVSVYLSAVPDFSWSDADFDEVPALFPGALQAAGPPLRRVADASAMPDIIYLVPDRYASTETLQTQFGLDNSAFYAALRERGFIVQENAWANYPNTQWSLASTLNSGYLEKFTEKYGAESLNVKPLFVALENNSALRLLKEAGYVVHNYGFEWEPTRINRLADYNPGAGELSEYENALIRMTPLSRARQLVDPMERRRCDFIREKLDYLADVGNGDRPVFAFFHFSVPHTPIVFDAEGNCLKKAVEYPGNGGDWRGFKRAYADYVSYFNDELLKALDRQFARRKGGRKVILAIQSDEGPYPKQLRERPSLVDYFAFSEEHLRMKLGVLNALYLGKGSGLASEDLLTPINNWRHILAALTGEEMPLLLHRSFMFRDKRHVYEFKDVSYLYSSH